MQRSKAQVLYRYLPGAVFSHEQGYSGLVSRVTGSKLSNLNRQVLLEEVAQELNNWAPDKVGIPDPLSRADEFTVIEPDGVLFDVYPLTFECTRTSCGRIRRWFNIKKLLSDTAAVEKIRCIEPGCGSRMRQLRYVTAHECGVLDAIRTPTCGNCKSHENMYLFDTGSFRSSQWHCRGCGGAEGGMRFTPCACNRYAGSSGKSFRTGYTTRDQRTWFPHSVTLVNLSSQTYDNFQKHPHRGAAALASLFGDELNLATSLMQLDQGSGGGTRKTPEEWAAQVEILRSSGLDEDLIENLRKLQGPVDSGVTATSGLDADVLKLGANRSLVERAGLFDLNVLDDRTTLAEVGAKATGPAATASRLAAATMLGLGIEDISVTQQFPLLVASYGYSRSKRLPGASDLKTYALRDRYDNKTPIFAVAPKTEALIATLDSEMIVGFLDHRGQWGRHIPTDRRAAKLAITELLASDDTVGGDGAAPTVRRLVHSVSHALVRALDDGQSGFGEASLAEWVATDALTTAVYVASYNEFTLGAFDTVLRRRINPWLTKAAEGVNHCDNDPMCSHTSTHRPHAACDRCLHLSFGCRTWNADLDRKLLRSFWTWTRQRASSLTSP